MENNKTKHTSGVWKVAPSENIGCVNVTFGEFKGGIECWYHHGDTMTKDEAVANAKLMAASPELLKSLSDLCEWLEVAIGGRPFANLDKVVQYKKAKEIIIKATE